MISKRNQFTASFIAKVAIEANKQEKTINAIASYYDLHPNQVTQWKKQLLDASPSVFARGYSKGSTARDDLMDELYRRIGVLNVELDWMKKNHEGSI